MTEPTLNYETPPLDRPTALRTTTWIYLLIFGLLYCLAGTCIGLSGIFAFSMLNVRRGMPGGVNAAMLFVFGILLLLPVGCGIVYIWTAVRLRRGSRAAAVTALVVSILNALCILALVVFGFIFILTQHGDLEALIGIAIYILPCAANVAAAILLYLTLRQMHRSNFPPPLNHLTT